MPTFYKSMESVFLGDDSSAIYNGATSLENWFRKFNPSMS